MKRRILFLTPTLNLGGAERSLGKAASRLADENTEVGIVVLCRTTNQISDELSASVQVFHLGARSTASVWLWWKTRRLIKQWKPGVVCGWSTYANFVAVVASAWLKNSTVAVSERNFLPRMLGQPGVGRIRRWLVRTGVRVFYRHADVVTANSEQSLRSLRRYVKGDSKYLLLPNMIDISYIDELAGQPLEESLSMGREVRLLCIGRLDRQKGFDVLLRALAQIESLWAWRLVVVGEGPLRESLEHLSKSLRFRNGQIHFSGASINPFPYYKWADIVIVPSRFEGFPNVALEAMAIGKPIIASNCRSGPSELTARGTFGILVAPEDTSGLANAVLSMCRNRDFGERLGKEARRHVIDTYTWDVVARQYDGLFSPSL